MKVKTKNLQNQNKKGNKMDQSVELAFPQSSFRRLIGVMLCLSMLFFFSCGPDGPYVEVNGTKYDESDLEDDMPGYHAELRKNYNEQLKRALSRLGEKKVMELAAKEDGVKDSDAYIDKIRNSVAHPSDAELKVAYDKLKKEGQIANQSMEELKGQLIGYIRSQSVRNNVEKKRAELKRKYGFIIGPEVRNKVDIEGEPSRSQDGRLLVVEFSGFECGYCKRVQETARQIRKKYGKQIKWVNKDYPLNLSSIYTHVATNCILEQSLEKYWQLFDAIYADDSRELNKEDKLNEKVASMGIDMKRFKACSSSATVRDEIFKDHKEGVSIGVRGIPHFVINGRSLGGAQPASAFEEVIEQELTRL